MCGGGREPGDTLSCTRSGLSVLRGLAAPITPEQAPRCTGDAGGCAEQEPGRGRAGQTLPVVTEARAAFPGTAGPQFPHLSKQCRVGGHLPLRGGAALCALPAEAPPPKPPRPRPPRRRPLPASPRPPQGRQAAESPGSDDEDGCVIDSPPSLPFW